MFPIRLYMGLVCFVILSWVIGGIQEGQTQMITQTQANSTMGMAAFSKGISIDTVGQAVTSFITGAADFVNDIVLYDWTVFYDVYGGYTSATCATAGGTWQSASSTCSIPNTFMFLRIFLIMVFGTTFVISIALLFRSLTLG
jgi:hypothetical protein